MTEEQQEVQRAMERASPEEVARLQQVMADVERMMAQSSTQAQDINAYVALFAAEFAQDFEADDVSMGDESTKAPSDMSEFSSDEEM